MEVICPSRAGTWEVKDVEQKGELILVCKWNVDWDVKDVPMDWNMCNF